MSVIFVYFEDSCISCIWGIIELQLTKLWITNWFASELSTYFTIYNIDQKGDYPSNCVDRKLRSYISTNIKEPYQILFLSNDTVLFHCWWGQSSFRLKIHPLYNWVLTWLHIFLSTQNCGQFRCFVNLQSISFQWSFFYYFSIYI